MRELLFIPTILLLLSCNESEIEDINSKNPIPYNTGELASDVVLRGDAFEGKQIILAGNAQDQYIVSFERELDGKLLDFTPTDDALPTIMKDNEGNKWNIFGYATDGPRKGQRLKPTQSSTARLHANIREPLNTDLPAKSQHQHIIILCQDSTRTSFSLCFSNRFNTFLV